MKGLLLVSMLVALSASMGAAEEFRKVEEGVFILGSKGESGVPSNVERKGWRGYAVQPEGDGKQVVTVWPEGGGQSVVTVWPEGDGGSVVTLWPGGPRTVKSNSRYNLIQGSIGLWDVMLAHYQPQRSAVPDTVIVQDIPYNGNANVLISFIRVVQTSGQNATPTIVSGGLGRTFVTLRLTSPPGQGFQFSIDIWGR